jgi:hypothetical protein
VTFKTCRAICVVLWFSVTKLANFGRKTKNGRKSERSQLESAEKKKATKEKGSG